MRIMIKTLNGTNACYTDILDILQHMKDQQVQNEKGVSILVMMMSMMTHLLMSMRHEQWHDGEVATFDDEDVGDNTDVDDDDVDDHDVDDHDVDDHGVDDQDVDDDTDLLMSMSSGKM